MSIKVAISGAGFIAGVHTRAIKNAKDAVVESVVEFDPAKGKAFAAEHGIKQVFISIDELIKAGGADALVIGVPNALHAPQAIKALSARIPVLVEKPMAMNAAEAEAMMETGQKNNTVLMVAHCWRFDEEALWLREQVETGILGAILRTKGYGVHSNWGPDGWFKQKALAGGGALVDMGIHALDTARFLLGDPEPESVYAKIGTNYIEADVDDTGVVIVTWKNGAVSYLEAGWWQPHMDGPEAATQLYGQKGFGSLFPTLLEIPNAEEMRVDITNPGYPFPREDHAPQAMYDHQMDYFLDCVKSGKTPVPGALEGWTNMRILDAAYRSAKEGKVIEL
jgi:predicted dehydrogenase